MAHDCDSGFCASRRDLLKVGAAGLTWGMFGLTLPNALFMREAYGLTPDTTIQRYDAIIQIFYSGGPSQTDTWDPKPGSANNVFTTINSGAKDVYGNPIMLSNTFPGIVSLLNDPAFGLGVIRSLTHGNGNHGTAQEYMNNFWGTVLATQYPSTAAVMAYYFQGQGLGIPSVVISGGNGQAVNSAKGGNLPTALTVQAGGANQGANPTVQYLGMPTGTDAVRYARRRRLMEAVNANVLSTRPDATVAAYDKAWKDAYDITTKGDAAKAFDLTGKPILPGGAGANTGDLQALTLAQNLVTAGIPYISCGIGGNDTHSGNKQGVTNNWGMTTDPAVTQMAKNLKATGKRVLVIMGGEFGRTPNSVAGGRDGRDHYPDGFSWAMLSINQPKFKTTAIGDTGPDGMNTVAAANLKDPIYPKDLGGLVYQVMGFLAGNSPTTDVPTITRNAPPVDRVNNSALLLKTFGLG